MSSVISVGIFTSSKNRTLKEILNKEEYVEIDKMKAGYLYESNLTRKDFVKLINKFPITRISIFFSIFDDEYVNLSFIEMVNLYLHIDEEDKENLDEPILVDILVLFPDIFGDTNDLLQ